MFSNGPSLPWLPCNISTTIAFPASINTHLYVQERKSSFTYDYVRDEETGFRGLPSIAEGHYEFDTFNEEPYWEPASVENELRKQLQNITLSEENLTWVKSAVYIWVCINKPIPHTLLKALRWTGWWWVWSGEEGSVECGGRGEGGGCQDTGRWLHRGETYSVLAGSSHHEPVQTSQCHHPSWSTNAASKLPLIKNTHTLTLCFDFYR